MNYMISKKEFYALINDALKCANDGDRLNFSIRVNNDKGKGDPNEVQSMEAGNNVETSGNFISVLDSASEFNILSAKENNKPLLLLIEDNIELINDFVERLSNKYRIQVARNGAEGLNMCEEIKPDVIVSEILLPGMNGIEIRKHIESNKAYRHILVIMLAAKANCENFFINGDNFDKKLLRPFNILLQNNHVNKFLKHNNDLLQLFFKQIKLEPTDKIVTSDDVEFLDEALRIIRENISNASFNVEKFST